MTQENAVAFINGRFLHRGEEYDETTSIEVVHTHVFDGPVARVHRAYGLTLNIGNYESARFDIRIEVPCYLEDVDNADLWAKKWVEDRCEKEIANVRDNKVAKKRNPSF